VAGRRGAFRNSNFVLLTLAVLLTASGCRQDMHDAPRYDPYEQSAFLPNGSSAQPLVEGTVPRVETAGAVLDEDELLHTGKTNGQLSTVCPFPIARADLDRGEERFNIYCSPCHGGPAKATAWSCNAVTGRPPTTSRGCARCPSATSLTSSPTLRCDARLSDAARTRGSLARYRVRPRAQLSHAAAEGDVPAAELEKLKGARRRLPPTGVKVMAQPTGYGADQGPPGLTRQLMTRPTAELSRLGSRSMFSRSSASSRRWPVPHRRRSLLAVVSSHIFWIDLARIASILGPAPDRRRWTMASRLFEGATRNLPLMAVLFLPIWFNLAKCTLGSARALTTKRCGSPASQGAY
jgi:hypothetical protein